MACQRSSAIVAFGINRWNCIALFNMFFQCVPIQNIVGILGKITKFYKESVVVVD
jgi:hypothetical protein